MHTRKVAIRKLEISPASLRDWHEQDKSPNLFQFFFFLFLYFEHGRNNEKSQHLGSKSEQYKILNRWSAESQ